MKWISDYLVKYMTSFDAPRDQYFCDFDRIKEEIRPCDVLLVEGHNLISRVIQQITLSVWSHAALYIGRPSEILDPVLREKVMSLPWVDPNTQLVIEGYIGEGTILNPLEYYRNYNLRICRPRGLLRSDVTKVISVSMEHLGAKYDVLQVFDLARFLLPWSFIPKRWRSSLFQYSPGTPTKTVCSTMIAEAFGRVKFPILPLIKVDNEGSIQLYQRNPKLFTPKDFDYSPYFEIIKFPFVTNISKSSYRGLPWNKQGLIANDLEIFDPSAIKEETNEETGMSVILQHLRRLSISATKWKTPKRM